jgi:acyl-CoA reductase-like NAD-dependent aldehyde dehydrogenase
MSSVVDPVVEALRTAIESARERKKTWEQEAVVCSMQLRRAADALPKSSLLLRAAMLESALTVPLSRRRTEVLEALRACLRSLVEGAK